MLIRKGARRETALRDISFIPAVARYADGSCVVKAGHSQIFCTATFDKKDAASEGKLSVGYGALPCAFEIRQSRRALLEAPETQETQAFIARALNACIDWSVFNHHIHVDCDVLQSEGSVKALAVSGAYAALALALRRRPQPFPLKGPILGVSCGILKGHLILDLDYEEEHQADTQGTFVFSQAGHLLESHTTSLRNPIMPEQMAEMAKRAFQALQNIFALQSEVLEAA